MNKIHRAVACSLGIHLSALALILVVNANGVLPRQAIENVPFIRAQLIYAMNGASEQKALPPREKERRPKDGQPPYLSPSQFRSEESVSPVETVPDALAREVKEAQTDIAMLPDSPSEVGAKVIQLAAIGRADANPAPDGGRQGEPAKQDTAPTAPPRYLSASRPAYPLLARMRGYEGVVLLTVDILADGATGQARIKKSSGYALLDQSALNAVKSWRFEPARNRGNALMMTVEIPIRFSLKDSL